MSAGYVEWFGYFMRQVVRRQEDTYYRVTRDGALSLDLPALLRSGRMNRQFDAARKLKRHYAREAIDAALLESKP